MPKRQKQNSDHTHKHHAPTIDNEVISQQLKALLTPAIFALLIYIVVGGGLKRLFTR